MSKNVMKTPIWNIILEIRIMVFKWEILKNILPLKSIKTVIKKDIQRYGLAKRKLN
tara:strand:- start:9381 stop:9548 length:168 start_codon:yes stop_codon:yes gene_type:complete